MKIIIIGAGVSGLTAYQFFRKLLPPDHNHEVKIYEAHNAPSLVTSTTFTIGGGIGLAPNGLRVLHSLSPELCASIIAQGFSQSKFTYRNSSGGMLGRFLHGSEQRYGFGNLLVARQGVHDAIREGVQVEYGKKILDVKELGGGVEILFDNGQVERADMIVGADGVRSISRGTVVGTGFEAEYQGLSGVGSFLSTSLLPPSFTASLATDPVCMTFGRCGFFGYGVCNPNRSRIMWWSTFPAQAPPRRYTLTCRDLKTQLLERHGDWASPYATPEANPFREMIELACDPERSKDRVLIIPVYTTPKLPRFTSASGRVVLVGDSAHAMPPDSGQGISMALEDAETIALLLSKLLRVFPTEAEALKKAGQYYNALRKPRVDGIVTQAKKKGEEQKKKLSWWGSFVRNLVLRIINLLPDGWIYDGKFGYVVAVAVEKALKKRI
ncbi:hypothetical protein RUND412_001655 [Rhizina undulata]